MICTNETPPTLERVIRRKWHQLEYRVNNQRSYLRKGIKNGFRDYEEFRQHAIDNGIEVGYHAHRPLRDDSYGPENLDFIPADEHYKLTAAEKRKLSVDDVKIIRNMASVGIPQRKIATQFNVSQTLIWRILNGLSYRDVQ